MRDLEISIRDVDKATLARIREVLDTTTCTEWSLKVGPLRDMPGPTFHTATVERLKADLEMPVFVPIVSSSQLKSR